MTVVCAPVLGSWVVVEVVPPGCLTVVVVVPSGFLVVVVVLPSGLLVVVVVLEPLPLPPPPPLEDPPPEGCEGMAVHLAYRVRSRVTGVPKS